MCWIWDLSVQSAGLYVDFQTNATEIFVRWTLEGDAVDGIIDCRLGRSREVRETLGHLSRYFRLHFLITTESPANERLPFITGMGGFLQFVANGMAGLITDQPGGLASHWACLPDGVDWIRLHGILHAGKRHCVELKRDASGKPVVEISPEAYSLR